MSKYLKYLLVVHGIFNLIGAVLLIGFAPLLDHLIGLSNDAAFLWQLLGVCAVALGFLSISAIRMNKTGVKSVIVALIIFNAGSLLVSLWGILHGLPIFIVGNASIHLLFTVLLAIGLLRLGRGKLK